MAQGGCPGGGSFSLWPHRATVPHRRGQRTYRWPMSGPSHTTEKANSLHAIYSFYENYGHVASSQIRTEWRKQTPSTMQITGGDSFFQSCPVGLGASSPGRQGGEGAGFHPTALASHGFQTLSLGSVLLEVWKIEKCPLSYFFLDHGGIPKNNCMSLVCHLKSWLKAVPLKCTSEAQMSM